MFFEEKLKTAISTEIKSYFDLHGISYDNSGTFEDLILAFFNFKDKAISSKPNRDIIPSKEIQEKLDCNPDLKELVDFFSEKIQKGEELTGWQSKTLFDADKPDRLFNHWNIKHLHMSKDKTRSNNILLFIETTTSVYLVDIVNHPSGSGWTAFDFLKTLHNNGWLEFIGFFPNLVIVGLKHKVTNDDDIYHCYKNNINILFEIEGVIYMPLGGSASSGNKLSHSEWLMQFERLLDNFLKIDVEFISFELDSDDCFGKIKYRSGNEELFYQIPGPSRVLYKVPNQDFQ